MDDDQHHPQQAAGLMHGVEPALYARAGCDQSNVAALVVGIIAAILVLPAFAAWTH